MTYEQYQFTLELGKRQNTYRTLLMMSEEVEGRINKLEGVYECDEYTDLFVQPIRAATDEEIEEYDDDVENGHIPCEVEEADYFVLGVVDDNIGWWEETDSNIEQTSWIINALEPDYAKAKDWLEFVYSNLEEGIEDDRRWCDDDDDHSTTSNHHQGDIK
jgi:hypothetical protein